jgi:FLYWCH zinc finger domain
LIKREAFASPNHPPFEFIFLSDYFAPVESLFSFMKGRKGAYHLVYEHFIYRSNFRRQGVEKNIFYWECIHNRKGRCRGRVKTIGDKIFASNSNGKLF